MNASDITSDEIAAAAFSLGAPNPNVRAMAKTDDRTVEVVPVVHVRGYNMRHAFTRYDIYLSEGGRKWPYQRNLSEHEASREVHQFENDGRKKIILTPIREFD